MHDTLEQRVVETALIFRRAETAHWVASEVGTDEAQSKTHAERGTAYIKFVQACENLEIARKQATK